MSDVWDEVRGLLNEGRGVLITLDEAQEVHRPKRRGRPRRIGPITYDHYAGARGLALNRPRCKAKGCDTFLKRDQPLFCSDECSHQTVNECLMVLAIEHYHLVERVDEYEEEFHGMAVMTQFLEENYGDAPLTPGDC